MMRKLTRLLCLLMMLLMMLPVVVASGEEVCKLPIDLSPGMKPDSNGYGEQWTYEDPTISVRIEEGVVQTRVGVGKCSYWVAEIKIADASQLRTMPAADFNSNRVTKGTVLAKRSNAVLALNGDYFCYTGTGYIVRQGVKYLDILKGDRDVLLVDENGDFHPVFAPQAGSLDGMVDGKKVINSFCFGPVLVHEGNALRMSYDENMASDTGRQRMAICQVGPLTYKAVCCAGPARGSSGLTLQEFADLCAAQGVQTAYNLDGGDSTMMIFGGEKINDVYNMSVREIADIVYFASAWGTEP